MSSNDFTNNLTVDCVLLGRVMTQATMLESMIDAYIAEYYTRCPSGSYQNSYLSFMYDVMNDRSVSLNTKKNILFKIHERLHGKAVSKGVKKLFDDWLGIRNKFAHGKHIGAGILYHGELFDVKDLANKHALLQTKILATLEQYSELRGPYFNHFPIKEKKI